MRISAFVLLITLLAIVPINAGKPKSRSNKKITSKVRKTKTGAIIGTCKETCLFDQAWFKESCLKDCAGHIKSQKKKSKKSKKPFMVCYHDCRMILKEFKEICAEKNAIFQKSQEFTDNYCRATVE